MIRGEAVIRLSSRGPRASPALGEPVSRAVANTASPPTATAGVAGLPIQPLGRALGSLLELELVCLTCWVDHAERVRLTHISHCSHLKREMTLNQLQLQG